VRWLRYEANGGLSAGVELLSLRAAPVGMRLHDADGAAKAPVRAVEIHELKDAGNSYFLAAMVPESEAIKIEVVRDGVISIFGSRPANEDIVAGLDALINAGDYAVLRPLRQDLVVPAPDGLDGVAA
jgi:hypothetical protein